MSGTQDHANAQDTHAEGHDAHEGPIKTPKQLIVAVFFAFVIPIVIIVMLANYVSSEIKPGAGGTGLEAQAVAAKLGDHDAWGPRVKSGFDTLVHSALKGKGNMGPQGGGDFSDFEISRAVVYMANPGGAKFDEPKLPAAAASGADAGASAPAAPASGASQ